MAVGLQDDKIAAHYLDRQWQSLALSSLGDLVWQKVLIMKNINMQLLCPALHQITHDHPPATTARPS